MSLRFADLEVCVVDDEEFSRSIVTRMLRKIGVVKVRHAVDGDVALNALRCLGRVDCMFLDFHMPRVNGLETLKRLRDGSAGIDRHIPVAMLTGHGDLSLVRTAMALDVNAFLTKPTSLDVVADRLLRMRSQEPEFKSPDAYAAVELPKTIILSSGLPLHLAPDPLMLPITRPERAGQGIRVPLERVPRNAQLARRVVGPDGALLLPEGTVLTARLLTHLRDLRVLDDCVAQLWIEPVAMAARSA